jgi:signal transduction histidine kinase
VVRNVMDNATRFAASSVVVTLAESHGSAVLTIADDGPGVPDDARERVFERFARHDSDRSRTGGGAGLGLAISREIVTAHGGTIGFDPGPGGRVTIRLPVSAAVG